MTTNDIIVICISIAALSVSIVSLYFSFFYKKVALVGNLISWNQNDPNIGDNQSNVAIEFSLSNIGNRELLIRNVEIDSSELGIHELAPVVKSKEVPCVLKPSQIILVSFDIPILYLEEITINKQKLLIRFEVIKPNGTFCFLEKSIQAFSNPVNWVYDELDWRPFTL